MFSAALASASGANIRNDFNNNNNIARSSSSSFYSSRHRERRRAVVAAVASKVSSSSKSFDDDVGSLGKKPRGRSRATRGVDVLVQSLSEKKMRVNRKKKQATLPDSTTIDYVSELDVKFLFDEISTDDLYSIEPLLLGEGGAKEDETTVIVDVGANIGLFSLEALKKCTEGGEKRDKKKYELYAFEPSPKTYEALRSNLERKFKDDARVSLRLANEAVGDGKEDTISFTSFPNAAGWSTAIEDEGETLANVVEYATALIIKHAPKFLMLRALARFVLEKNLFFVKSAVIKSICFFVVKWLSRGKKVETVPCVTLSDAIFNDKGEEEDETRNGTNSIKKKINLLKIDVERYELAVLAGIRDEDFANIDSIVLEVHDGEDKTGVRRVVDVLHQRGKFSLENVKVVQPDHLKGSTLYNVFAFRRRRG
jgi:FkbM family methyltransferase